MVEDHRNIFSFGSVKNEIKSDAKLVIILN
jgi:hypothetical protein